MSKTKILVTGADGQLGKELQVISKEYPMLDFVFFNREQLSIDDREKVMEAFSSIQPRYCINCAAYTAVDRAESEQEKAFLINGTATGILAYASKDFNTRFIHISTDYVFNGTNTMPYRENDRVDPVNAYGASKLKGEELALSVNEESVIIRTSWVYSSFGDNFVKTMLRLMRERESLGVVNDQSGSPTYAADLAALIATIVSSNTWKPGLYHYSNEGIITWYEFAKAIATITGSSCKVNPITTADFPTPAKRPSYSGFDKEKIRTEYDVEIPDWRSSLERCIQKLAI